MSKSRSGNHLTVKLASLGSSASWLTSPVRLEHINLGIRQLQLTGMAPALSILQLYSPDSLDQEVEVLQKQE